MTTDMEFFEVFPWNSNFDTGIEVIDEQHQKLVELINLLANTLVGGDQVEISRVFDELANYANHHFETEEEIWVKYFGLDSWLESHQLSHASFLPKVLEIKNHGPDEPLRGVTEEVLKFLIRWLAFHIIDNDKRMALVIENIDAGKTLDEAKIISDKKMTGSIRVLINAVLMMYEELSSRSLDLLRERIERQKIEGNLLEANNKLQELSMQDEKSLRILSSAIDQSPSIMFITDANGIIEYVNHKFSEMIGYSADEVIGQNPRILKTEDTLPEVHADLWRTIKSGREWRHEIKDKCKDGKEFWAYATIAPIYSTEGELTHFVAVHENITERKEAELAIRKAKEEAETANKAKSTFLASMSHELRTPLNAIIGFSDLIKCEIFGPVKPPQYLGYANDIYESGSHLLSLVSEVLDMSKVESGEFDIYTENLVLQDMIKDTLVMSKLQIEKAKLNLNIDIPTDLPHVMADRRTIKQILINLLTNSIKFTPKGGTITIHVSKAADMIAVSVIDTGIGMEKENIERALEPFVQIERENNTYHEGTGLGLPLCKHFAELNGGIFSLESEKGKGTTATFTLPLNDAQDLVESKTLSDEGSAPLSWLPSMSVGVDQWDADHQKLLELIGKLRSSVLQKNSDEEISTVFDTLDQYLEIHLRSEEAVMKKMKYPKYIDHKMSHDSFRERLKEQQNIRRKSPDDWDSETAVKFLVNWWYTHILKEDMAYKTFFENRRERVVELLAKYNGIGISTPRH